VYGDRSITLIAGDDKLIDDALFVDETQSSGRMGWQVCRRQLIHGEAIEKIEIGENTAAVARINASPVVGHPTISLALLHRHRRAACCSGGQNSLQTP
jgi:hypothetical protein